MLSEFWIRGLSAILSGVLLVLALPPFNAGGLAWVALIPVLLANGISVGEKPVLSRWRLMPPGAIGYWMGLFFFAGAFWWVAYVTVVGVIALILYLAVYPALWVWAHDQLKSRGIRSIDTLSWAATSASVWVVLEWCRSWFLTGLGWNGLAVTQHRMIPMVQLASVGGTLLISWLIVFVNVVLACAIRRAYEEIRSGEGYRRHWDLYLTIGLLMGTFFWGMQRIINAPKGELKSIRYALVQPNIPQDEKYEAMNATEVIQRHVRMSREALLMDPELLVWPETATGKIFKTDFELRAAVNYLMRGKRFDFVMGALDVEEGKQFNAAFWFPPNEKRGKIYRKNHLVLFGEYTPFWDTFPHLGRWFPMTPGFDAGEGAAIFELREGAVRALPLICFEDTVSDLARRFNEEKPDFLLNLTNDAWFKDSPGAEQHLANAIFRTVELDLPMLRCANSGVSAVVNQSGAVLDTIKDDQGRRVEVDGVKVGLLQWAPSRVTLYEKYGNWIVIFSLLIIGLRLWRRVGAGRGVFVNGS